MATPEITPNADEIVSEIQIAAPPERVNFWGWGGNRGQRTTSGQVTTPSAPSTRSSERSAPASGGGGRSSGGWSGWGGNRRH